MSNYEAPFPIIELRIEGMKRMLHAAISEHEIKYDEQIKAALEQVCSSGHIGRTIRAEVERSISNAISASVERYFRHGDGAKVVNEMVENILRATTAPETEETP